MERRVIAVLLMATALLATACSGASVPSPSVATLPTSSLVPRTEAPATSGPSPTPEPIRLLGSLPTAAVGQATGQRLQVALDGLVAGGAPDMLAAVITADGTWSGAAGTMGPDGAPATPDGVFAVASATKTAVATLLLRLAELGKVDLDARAETYLPELAEVANGATVRQLLAMRGGLGETTQAVIDAVLADCTRLWTQSEIIAGFPARAAQPDRIFVYSNPGFKLAGFVAEKVSGMPLSEAMRTYVAEPAGVTRFVMQGPDSPAPKPWALPIASHLGPLEATDYGAGGTLPCVSDSTFGGGGTAMASDAASLARWAWQLFAGEIVDEASLGQLLTIDADDYGLGIWRLHDFGTDVAYGHAGNKPGFAPIYVVFPERQVVIALCISDQDADPYPAVRALLRALEG